MARWRRSRSEEHTSELQSRSDLVCRLLLETKKRASQLHPRTYPVGRFPPLNDNARPCLKCNRASEYSARPGDLTRYIDCALPFFFNDPATTEIYPLSLHDALPISRRSRPGSTPRRARRAPRRGRRRAATRSEEHTSELQSRSDLVCRLLLEKK